MKKFKFVGSYAKESIESKKHDYFNEIIIPLSKGGSFSEYGMDHVNYVIKKIESFPTEDAYDLMALALLVYIADTRISRSLHSQDSWTREIFIELPVYRKVIWDQKRTTIERMLRFLTGDIWTISFTNRTLLFADSDSEKTNQYDAISLFSGGMDSLISTVNQMELGKNTILVAHAAEGLVKKAQTDIISKLDE